MAKKSHIRWLLEGVDAWNRRRENEQFEPDFSCLNLYEVFEQRGELGDDGFVPLDGVNLQYADLRRAVFQKPSSADATSITTFSANLRGANLNMANLYGAELARAKLDEADLSDANLSRANLDEVILKGANLSGSSLIKTNLAHSDLTGANLSRAVLKDAILWEAQLDGVNFYASEPWQANFYSSPGLESSATLSSADANFRTIRTVGNLLDAIRELTLEYERELSSWPAALGVPALEQPAFYFRGHADSTWELTPYAMRHDGTRDSEGPMLHELALRRPEDFSESGSALSWWVLAQHHGLPTRFLDLSRNPLVALFHGCGSEENWDGDGLVHVFVVVSSLIERFDSVRVSIVANFAKLERSKQAALLGVRDDTLAGTSIGRYWSAMRELCDMVRRENPQFGDYVDVRHLVRVFVIEPQQSLERLRVQSGAFLASAFHERFEREQVLWGDDAERVLGIGRGIPIYDNYQLLVPADAKRGILDELEMLDVTRERLFPGLDSAAERIKNLFVGVGGAKPVE